MTPILAEFLWRPYFDPIVVIVAAIVLAGLAMFVCVRTWRTNALISLNMLLVRLAVIAGLCAVLMGPSQLPRVIQSPTQPTLTVLLDTSGSMQTADMDNEPRYDFAVDRWLGQAQRDALSEHFQLNLVTFDAKATPASLDAIDPTADTAATARRSNIAEAIQSTVARLPPSADGSAVLVLTDGKDSDNAPLQPAISLAKERSIPVHTVTLGGASLTRDVALVAVPAQPYLLAGEEGLIDVRVVQNAADNAQTVVHLKSDGVASSHPIHFDGQREVRLKLPIKHDEPGTYEYELWCEPVEGEVEEVNNRQLVFIDTTASRFRVLLLEGQPYWDTKFIAQSLRKDDRVELVQITQVTPDRQEIVVSRADPKTARLPQSLDELATFDVVILGGSIDRVLPMRLAEQLPAFVRDHGGGVVFARGRAYEEITVQGRQMGRALSVLEPVVFGQGSLPQQEIAVMPAGVSHPSLSFLRDKAAGDSATYEALLPQLKRLPVVEREKDATLVLAATRSPGTAATGQPVVVTMPYASGQVVGVLGEGLWRWSMLARRNPDLAGVYDQFWSNMIRWLAMGSGYTPGKDVSLRLTSRGVQVGEQLRAELATRDPGLINDYRLEIIGPDDQTQRLALIGSDTVRRYGTAQPTEPGIYTVRAIPKNPPSEQVRAEQTLEARFSVFDIDLERLESAADPGPMRMLAEQTGGKALSPYEPGMLIEMLKRYRAMSATPPQPIYIWDRGIFLFLLLFIAGFEWIARKLGGML
jgi:hypothetical protein